MCLKKISTFKVNGLDLISTTDGFFIIFLNDISPEQQANLQLFPIMSSIASKITQRDITNLLISEFDYNRYNYERKIQSEHEISLSKFCALFNNQLEIISSINDMFHTIYDFNGNKLFVYTRFNNIFIPHCN